MGNDLDNRWDPTGYADSSNCEGPPTPPDPTKHFWCTVLGGFAGVAAGGVVAVTIAGATGGARTLVGVIAGGAVAGGFGQLVNNACEGEPDLGKDVAVQTLMGGVFGGAGGYGVGKGIETGAGGVPE